MKATTLYAALLAVPFFGAAAASADDGPLLVRLRILDMQVDNKNSNTPAQYQSLGQVKAENKTFPEVDFTYFFTPNIASELILTYPQKHEVTLGGTNIGSIKHLPPTLTVQYHFIPDGTIRPYVGAGINYTRFMSVNLLNGAVDVDKNSFGLAGQVGVDYKLDRNWFLNLDAKYVRIDTKVKFKASGQEITDLGVNPWLLSVGIGYRF